MYIVGGGNYVLISTDLGTWTSYSLPNIVGGCNSLAFANGVFMLGSGSFGAICTSTDGQTWVIQYEPTDHSGAVTVEYLNNMFVCVCGNWKYIITSSDGTNLDISENIASGFVAVAYGQNKFVFVGNDGIIYNSYIAGKKNIIADLTPESDMTFNLERGSNEIIYLTDGNTQATLSYRQKYIGV